MAINIYTKTGDLGKTSLIGGTKVSKNNIRIETYGTIDELNSYIGLVSDHCNDEDSKKVLKEIQDRLFTIGSSLACDPDKDQKLKIPDLKETDVAFLEKEIDAMNETFYFTGWACCRFYNSYCTLRLPPCRKMVRKYAGTKFIC